MSHKFVSGPNIFVTDSSHCVTEDSKEFPSFENMIASSKQTLHPGSEITRGYSKVSLNKIKRREFESHTPSLQSNETLNENIKVALVNSEATPHSIEGSSSRSLDGKLGGNVKRFADKNIDFQPRSSLESQFENRSVHVQNSEKANEKSWKRHSNVSKKSILPSVTSLLPNESSANGENIVSKKQKIKEYIQSRHINGQNSTCDVNGKLETDNNSVPVNLNLSESSNIASVNNNNNNVKSLLPVSRSQNASQNQLKELFTIIPVDKEEMKTVKEELYKDNGIIQARERNKPFVIIVIKIPKNLATRNTLHKNHCLQCLDSFSAIRSEESDDTKDSTVQYEQYLSLLIGVVARLEAKSEYDVLCELDKVSGDSLKYIEERLNTLLDENDRALLNAKTLLQQTSRLHKKNRFLKQRLGLIRFLSKVPQLSVVSALGIIKKGELQNNPFEASKRESYDKLSIDMVYSDPCVWQTNTLHQNISSENSLNIGLKSMEGETENEHLPSEDETLSTFVTKSSLETKLGVPESEIMKIVEKATLRSNSVNNTQNTEGGDNHQMVETGMKYKESVNHQRKMYSSVSMYNEKHFSLVRETSQQAQKYAGRKSEPFSFNQNNLLNETNNWNPRERYFQEVAATDKAISQLKCKILEFEEEKLMLSNELVMDATSKNKLKGEHLWKLQQEDKNLRQKVQFKETSIQRQEALREEGTFHMCGMQRQLQRQENIRRYSLANKEVIQTLESTISTL